MAFTVVKINEQYGVTKDVLTYVETYDVQSDAVSTTIAAYSATGLPNIGDQLSGNPIFRVADVQLTRKLSGSTPTFTAIVTYSTSGPSDDENPDNPLDRPPVIGVSFTKISAPFTRDINGTAMRNSSRQLFEGITSEIPVMQVTIQKNVADFDAVDASIYINTINSVAFQVSGLTGVFPALTCKIESITANKRREYDIDFWDVTISFLALPEVKYFNGGSSNDINNDGTDDSLWDAIEPDRGTVYLVGNQQTNIPDSTGQTLNGVTLLDGSGGILGPTASPVYRVFQILRRKDFTEINTITG